MAKYKERMQARKLRKEKGLSIKQISQQLGVSKSTVSIWCRDVQLTEAQEKHLMERMIKLGHRGRMKGAEMNKEKRKRHIRECKRLATKQLGNITQRDILIAGIALHWGEGSKGRRFDFSNSDPEMIMFVKKFLVNVMGIESSRIAVRVLINEIHEPRIDEVTKFWIELLNIPSDQMRKPTFVKVKPKKIYANYDNYYGTLKMSVLRSSGLQYKMLELTNVLKKKAGVAQLVGAPHS